MRVPGGSLEAGEAVLVLSFVDLRYEDGRTERWIGPGSATYPLEGPAGTAELLKYGADRIEEQGGCLLEELDMAYTGVTAASLDEVPTEVVFEWNALIPPEGVQAPSSLIADGSPPPGITSRLTVVERQNPDRRDSDED